MAAVPFDTLKLARALEGAGFPAKQAGDTAEALADALGQEVVTRDYLDAKLQPVRTDIAVLKWMQGFNLAATMGVVTLLLRH
jgi:hypothetical protein